MEPNHQLFGHYLSYRMEMQKDMAEKDEEKRPGWINVSGIRAAFGKLFIRIASSCKRPAANAEPELVPQCLDAING